jgi:hypothetical protein
MLCLCFLACLQVFQPENDGQHVSMLGAINAQGSEWFMKFTQDLAQDLAQDLYVFMIA